MPRLSRRQQPCNHPIVLVGGSVRAAAADAKRAGYDVIAVDRFGDRDLLSICNHWIKFDPGNQWISQLAEFPPCPIVPVGGFDWPICTGVKNKNPATGFFHAGFVAYPDPVTLERLNSPAWLGSIAASCGVHLPETRALVDAKMEPIYRPDVRSMMETDQWLRKPKFHAGGIGIAIATENACLSPDEFLQRRLRGEPIGANFIAYQHDSRHHAELLGVFRGITYRHNRSHPFLYGGSVGPIILRPDIEATIKRLGQSITTEFNLLGLFNIDLLLGEGNELALLEVNPRYSASMELIPISKSLIDWHLGCYRHRVNMATEISEQLQGFRQHPFQTFACKRIVYAETAIQNVSFRSVNMTYSQGSVSLCDLPNEATPIAAGDPICTVMVSGANSIQVAFRLSALCDDEILYDARHSTNKSVPR